MTTYAKRDTRDRGAVVSRRLPFGLLKDLERPRDLFRDLGPNWYATVMGTGPALTPRGGLRSSCTSCCWPPGVTVAIRTAHGAATGRLFRPAAPAPRPAG
jgi:hypothetical protein